MISSGFFSSGVRYSFLRFWYMILFSGFEHEKEHEISDYGQKNSIYRTTILNSVRAHN